MPRHLLPFSLSAGAFAAAWWAASAFPPQASSPSVQGSAGLPGLSLPSSAAPAAADDSTTSNTPKLPPGFARREAELLDAEITDPASIRRLLEKSPQNGETVTRLIKVWAEQDPAGAWQWLENGGRKKLGFLDVSNLVIEAWFRQDSAAALAAFRGMDPQRRSSAASGLLYLLTSRDPALRAKLLPCLDEIVAANSGFSLGTESSETAAMLSTLPPGSGRDSLMESTGRNWLETDWKAASAWVSGLTEPLKSKIMATMALTAFSPNARRFFPADGKPASHADPECFEWARKWFTTEAPPALKQQLGEAFLTTLAEKDPAAALEWAQDNLASRSLTKAMSTVLSRQAAKDPAAARALVEDLPPGGLKQRAAFGVVTNPDAESVTWLISQADNKKENTEWYQIASGWAFKKPEDFKKYLAEAAPDSLPSALVSGGLSNLLRKDAPGTMAWALGTGNPRTAAAALSAWGQNDQPAAAAWLTQNTTARDWSEASLSSFAGNYFWRSPEDSITWASALPPGKVRDTTLASLRKSLSSNSGLNAEKRAALEARLNGKP